MFVQFDLVVANTVKLYNVLYWIYRLSNFTLQRFSFENFLIPQYIVSSGRHARRIRLQEIRVCGESVVLSDCNQNWNNLASLGDIS